MAGDLIRPKDLPPKSDISPNARIAADDGTRVFGPTISEAVGQARPFATQPEAAAGTSTTATMNPLTTKQSIASEVGVSLASKAQGDKADGAVQPADLAAVAISGEYEDLAGKPDVPPGLADGDKGDISVSGSGVVWDINDRAVTPIKLKDADAKGFRMAANVRGRVNFFDFLQNSRSAAVREQIMNGTFTGDLAVEWQAFRDSLWAIAQTGGRPHGFIPECTIYSSVAPNFAMDWLRLETQGTPEVRGIGSARGLTIDGTDIGQGGFGPRNMRIGPIVAGCTGNAEGVFIKHVHQSYFEGVRSRGAITTGIHIDGCVWSEFKDLVVSSRIYLADGVGPGDGNGFLPGAWPTFGINITGTADAQNSWCKFDMAIVEDTPGGILMTHALGNSFFGGGAEGCPDTALAMGTTAAFNKFYGLDFEANGNYDIFCEGTNNEFHGTDAPFSGVVTFSGPGCYGNKIFGGRWATVNFGSATSLNLGVGMNVSTLNDESTGINRNKFSGILSGGVWRDDQFTAYTPAVAASAGAITSYVVNNAQFKQEGKLARVHIDVTITNSGTGAGSINLSLPFPGARYSTLSGQEIALSSKGLCGAVISGAKQVVLNFTDATYPGATGARLIIDGTYEIG